MRNCERQTQTGASDCMRTRMSRPLESVRRKAPGSSRLTGTPLHAPHHSALDSSSGCSQTTRCDATRRVETAETTAVITNTLKSRGKQVNDREILERILVQTFEYSLYSTKYMYCTYCTVTVDSAKLAFVFYLDFRFKAERTRPTS